MLILAGKSSVQQGLIMTDPHIEGDAKVARMGWRGVIDLWGNDHYLGHIHRTMRAFVRPTQTVILGDHMSSQWIDDAEFYRRSQRFEDKVLQWRSGQVRYNISGNHDIGYAGDLTSHRLTRWHLKFGPSNYVSEISADTKVPHDGLRIIGLNDLLLDGPAIEESLRNETLSFLVDLPADERQTILLLHVPLHKDAGICVDSPRMTYYDSPQLLLREQNHLSEESSRLVMQAVFGSSDGFILSGHDHEGCHTIHSLAQSQAQSDMWTAQKFQRRTLQTLQENNMRVIEEATVRSVMGQYGGNAGLLTATFDRGLGSWKFKYRAVPFMHNTLWWLSHICSTSIIVCLFVLWFCNSTQAGRKASLRCRSIFQTSYKRNLRKDKL